jgi:hypothetical protein
MQGAGVPPPPCPPAPLWVTGDVMMTPDGAGGTVGLFLFEEGESCRRQVC